MQSGVNKRKDVNVDSYFAHLSIDHHPVNIAGVGHDMAAGCALASVFGRGTCRRPFSCNHFTLLTLYCMNYFDFTVHNSLCASKASPCSLGLRKELFKLDNLGRCKMHFSSFTAFSYKISSSWWLRSSLNKKTRRM